MANYRKAAACLLRFRSRLKRLLSRKQSPQRRVITAPYPQEGSLAWSELQNQIEGLTSVDENYEAEEHRCWQQLRKQQVPAKLSNWVLLASLALFVVVSMASFRDSTSRLTSVVILVGVLFLHEMGHFWAMKWFGYQNPSILFLPFFGAATIGHKEDATLTQKIWVLLAGPLPGLLLGIVIVFAIGSNPSSAPAWLLETSAMLIPINLFNLLPIYPLDGGKIVNLLLWPCPYAEVWLKACAVIVLIGVGLFSLIKVGLYGFPILGIALVVGLTIPISLRSARLFVRFQTLLKSSTANDRLIQTAMKAVRQSKDSVSFDTKYHLVKELIERHQTTASRPTRVFFTLLYTLSLFGSIVGSYQTYSLPGWQALRKEVQESRQWFDRRIEAANRSLHLNPNDAGALHRRAAAYLERDGASDIRAAIRDYETILQLNPNDALAYRMRGKAYYQSGNYQGAIQDSEQALRLYPADAAAYRNRGNARQKLGNSRGAIEDYEQAMRLDINGNCYCTVGIEQDYQTAHFGLTGKSAEALLQTYNQALRLNPKDVDKYWRRGEVRYLLNDRAGALQDYTQALRLRPNEAKGYLKRAVLQQAKGKLQDYTQALRLRPDDVTTYLSRAKLRGSYEVGDQQGALEDYQTILSLNSEAIGTYFERGETRKYDDKLGAIADYSRVLRFNPNDAEAYRARAGVYYDRGDFSKALQDYNQLLTFESYPSLVYLERGKTQYQLRNYKPAIQDFEQYHDSLSQNPIRSMLEVEVYIWRGMSRYQLRDYPGALSDYNRVIQSRPYASNYQWRATIQYQLGNNQAAIADATESIRLEPDTAQTADAYSLRSQARHRMGDKRGATADQQAAERLSARHQR